MSIDTAAAKDLKWQTLAVLTKDLGDLYVALVNAAGSVMTAAVTARTALVIAGESNDPKVGEQFEQAMENLDRVVGQTFAPTSQKVLALQNRIRAGAAEMLVKG